MKNFKEMGLVELDPQSAELTNGGFIATTLAVIGAAIYVYNNADDFVDGFNAGAEAASNN